MRMRGATGIQQVGMAMGLLWGASLQAAAPVKITLLHTNDLHSHFRGEKTVQGLGGVARLKTAIREIRTAQPNSLLVDGGDWSEGNIYYTEGAGRETLRMMDHLTYDVSIVGNHDWLNGADNILRVLGEANPALSLLATNIDTREYERESEFRRKIPPYVIKEVAGVKIAFIGLLTYEFVFDKFFKPIKITEPLAITRELAHRLRKSVDVVVALSHNNIKLNQGILLAAPELDFIVGAHDHVKLTRPVMVNRPGAKPGFIVETGSWGRYLGRVDIKVSPRDPAVSGSRGSMELVNYRLIQMDSTIAEDPETRSKIEALEALIETKRGPIFHDHVGDSEIDISRSGMESLMGDFATDAYVKATGADLAMDVTPYIYNEIHEGPATSADLFNSNPGVYSPITDKAWTLRVVPLRGRTLRWILNILYGIKRLSQSGIVNFSGVEMIFNPFLQKDDASYLSTPVPMLADSPMDAAGIIIKSLKIHGEEIDPDRKYRLAAPGGMVETLLTLNQLLPNAVPLDEMKDTGVEDWRVLADHLRSISPVTLEKMNYGNRIRTLQPDLGLLSNDIRWEPLYRDTQNQMVARVHVRVRNTGSMNTTGGAPNHGPRIVLQLNAAGVDYSVDYDYRDIVLSQGIPALAPGQSTEFTWEQVVVPESRGLFAIVASIRGTEIEVNHSNDQATRTFDARIEDARRFTAGAIPTPLRLQPNPWLVP